LLPVIDNLERALGSDVSTSPERLGQGVQMTLQQLTQLLRRHGIEPEESLGRPFEALYHEAVSARHDPSKPDHVILETYQRGYRRGNEVFRRAKVVASNPSQAEAAAVTMTIWYPKCHRLGISEYWARQLHGGASSKTFPTDNPALRHLHR
jgi:hypothetical protein